MTKIKWTAALVVLALVPAVVMAQSSQERLDAAITHAEETGIAVSLLQSKIAEGRAKSIPMDRIAIAVENRLRNLERAKIAMSRAGDVDAAQLSVGADAIAAGVSESVLTQIARSATRDRRAVAVAVLTQLVSHGIAPDAAVLQVKDALAHGPQALANLASQTGAAGRGAEGGNSQGNTSGASSPRTGGPPSAPAQPPTAPVPPSARGLGRGGR